MILDPRRVRPTAIIDADRQVARTALLINLDQIDQIGLNVIRKRAAMREPSMRVAIRLDLDDATLIELIVLAHPRAGKLAAPTPLVLLRPIVFLLADELKLLAGRAVPLVRVPVRAVAELGVCLPPVNVTAMIFKTRLFMTIS